MNSVTKQDLCGGESIETLRKLQAFATFVTQSKNKSELKRGLKLMALR
jgi:hypothetical protein